MFTIKILSSSTKIDNDEYADDVTCTRNIDKSPLISFPLYSKNIEKEITFLDSLIRRAEEICSARPSCWKCSTFVRPLADGAKEQRIKFFGGEIFRQRLRITWVENWLQAIKYNHRIGKAKALILPSFPSVIWLYMLYVWRLKPELCNFTLNIFQEFVFPNFKQERQCLFNYQLLKLLLDTTKLKTDT